MPGPSGRRWPLGLVGMVALIGLIELTLASHEHYFQNTVSESWASTGRAILREATRNDVLCFGDSLLKFGFRPELISGRTHRSAYNLTVLAGRAPSTYFLLRQALDAGARPSALVIDYEPNILAGSPLPGHELMAEVVTPRDAFELAWESGDPGILGQLLVARTLPSMRYRPQIRAAIQTTLAGLPFVRGVDVPGLLPDSRKNRGSMIVPHIERAAVPADPGNFAFFPPEWRCHPLNRRYVRKFLELAQAHEIPVFWVLPPYAPPIRLRREWLGQDALMTQFAKSYRSKFPNLTIIDARKSGYPHDVFWDNTVHLDDRGSIILSTDLAEVLARSLSGEKLPKWVQVPDDLKSAVAAGKPRVQTR